MRISTAVSIGLLLAGSSVAQVDTAHRRVLVLQSGIGVNESEEQVGGLGYFWFNEGQFPWDNTALRMIYAGVYLDTELSVFIDQERKTAVGAALEGGAYVDSVVPYVDGERLSHQTFHGDRLGARLFINHELAEIPICEYQVPLNARGTYRVSERMFRESSTTKNFTLPDDFLLQTIMAELRFGALRPVVPNREGFEMSIGAEANYRSGFDAFGPNTGLYPAESEYQRVFANMAGEFPVGPVRIYGRIGGGMGDNIDELSAWRIGGNFINTESYSQTLHGYYTSELFAEDFGIANFELIVPLVEEHQLSLHFYGDYAVAHLVPPQDGDWHNFFGTGAGVSFTTVWRANVLIDYGYGFNAVRNSDQGGHEVALAVRKEF